MVLYFVKDASGWLSNYVFRSQVDAIISQKWRLEDPAFNVSNDYPLTLMEIDTKYERMKEVKELSEADFKSYVEKYYCKEKGGSK